MTYEETLSYIHSIDWRGSRPGLSRVTELLKKLGDPQDDLKFIHVGGTNGKGSFCAMISSVLSCSGLKTGLFTSPYIENFNERMSINGDPISNTELADLTSEVRIYADAMEDPPTEFELITAIAMLYFRKNGCDIVVLEVGLGGRLDATNIIKDPVLSVISGISLDHTAILGETVREIAAEKAGIIKSGRPVLLGCATAKEHYFDVFDVVSDFARRYSSDLYTADMSRIKNVRYCEGVTVFDFEDMSDLKISMLGIYQPANALNVLCALEILKNIGYRISENDIRSGLALAHWKARFEKISDDPYFIFDGAHNPQGVSAAISGVKTYFKNEKLIVITGVMADKDYFDMASQISSVAAEIFTLKPDNPRALDQYRLSQLYSSFGIKSTACEDIYEAVKKACLSAKKSSLRILALGSLYMYSDVKKALYNAKKEI
ncbi:MAG: bifunctional folylpolyglutamate synthase/dihydrofolate synthase [Clostridia bacterium]|nr:bifunctional folylpolyglutamate synthase/dihydrofolate synthase [Clostridia bacterium]